MKKISLLLIIVLCFCISYSFASIKLTCPNGGEKFVVGSDTLITWEGISPTDTVKLEYSIDNGVSWKLISDKAQGLNHIWKNVPKPTSNMCLVRIQPFSKIDSWKFEPTIEWQKTYGGSQYEESTSMQNTKDGGCICAGYTTSSDGDITNSKGSTDAWVVKLNSSGVIEWQKNYGGSLEDGFQSIKQTADGGYILAGHTKSNDGDGTDFNGSSDWWIVKINSSGTIEWQKTYGGSRADRALNIAITSDGGYIIAGDSYSIDGDLSDNSGLTGICIAKINSMGSIEWDINFGGDINSWPGDILQTSDGGYISTKYSDLDGEVTKLNSNGSIEWQKTYGGNGFDGAYTIKKTQDNGFILLGFTNSNDGDFTGNKGGWDAWVIKIDSTGNLEWQKTLGGSKDDYAYDVELTNDGGYIIAGRTNSNDGDVNGNNGDYDGWVIKLNSSGTIEWQKNIGGNKRDFFYQIQKTNDGGYFVSGYSESTDIPGCINKGAEDFYLVKLGPSLQSDQSDSVFSIVAPEAQANDIDMGKQFVGMPKDSLIIDFISNTGQCKFRVDSIYFSGAYKDAFRLVSDFPKYSLLPGEKKSSHIEFLPNKTGLHTAKINIILESDTLIRNIQGMGIGKLIIGINNDSAYAGQIKTLKLMMIDSNPSSIAQTALNFSAKIRFEKTILTPSNKSEISIINDSSYMNISGRITADNELGQFLVTAGLGKVEQTTIDIVEFILKDDLGNPINYEIEKHAGLFKLLGICHEGGTRLIHPTGKAEISSIIPNPASDEVVISVNLIEDSPTTLSIFNSNGTKIKEINLICDIGLQSVKLNAREFANGLYFIQLQTPTVLENKKLVIIR
ncbi:MAG: T9SS type A sorting domain-containing protein [bacterium]